MNENDYLICREYEEQLNQVSSKYPGFIVYQHDNGKFYFAVPDGRGGILLRSEGYPNEGARDNGIKSVQKNLELEERYSIEEAHGAFFTILKAGNHQEIARSCPVNSREEAEAMFPSKRKLAMAAGNDSDRREDNYLACQVYRDHLADKSEKYPGFITFTHEDGQHYFGVLDAQGELLFRSEGYPTTGARDNGIQSVQKNIDLEERYSTFERSGHHFVTLKAGNHQEIARSCPYDSADAAMALYPSRRLARRSSDRNVDEYLDCDAYQAQASNKSEKYPGFITFQSEEGEHYFALLDSKGEVMLRSEGYPSTGARDNGIQSVQKNMELEERYSTVEEDGQHLVVLKAGNHQEIARSCPYASAAAAFALYPSQRKLTMAAAAGNDSDRNVDEYLDCDAYQAQASNKSEKYPGFITFQSEEGEHYFALLDSKGEVMLRSEGYPSTGARDNGIQSVQKNMELEERYSTVEEDGQHLVVLKAGNHQEIARSCPYASAAAAFALYPSQRKLAMAAAAGGDADRREDNYLACKVYKSHLGDKSTKYPGFITFTHEDGQHYFGVLNAAGDDLRFRSEGYPSTGARDNGIESVQKNIDNEARYSTFERGGKHFVVLKAGNHQEIARSCPYDDAAAAAGWFPGALAAAAAALAAAPAIAAAMPDMAMSAPAVEKVTAAPKVPVPTPKIEAAYTPPVEVAATGGSNLRWLWWLLGALLLLGLLWFLMRSCSKDAKVGGGTDNIEANTPPPAETEAAETETEVAAPPPPPVDLKCDCGQSNPEPIMRLKGISGTPKALKRLGSNPEFGDSHGLTPAQFYDKLKAAHANNAVDQEFLDRIFKAMGYANGFTDAKPEQFSEAVIPFGTVCNIGYSKMHKTQYSVLNLGERDQQAFRIQASNGCHMHFMKTCGNHMFMGENCQ